MNLGVGILDLFAGTGRAASTDAIVVRDFNLLIPKKVTYRSQIREIA